MVSRDPESRPPSSRWRACLLALMLCAISAGASEGEGLSLLHQYRVQPFEFVVHTAATRDNRTRSWCFQTAQAEDCKPSLLLLTLRVKLVLTEGLEIEFSKIINIWCLSSRAMCGARRCW